MRRPELTTFGTLFRAPDHPACALTVLGTSDNSYHSINSIPCSCVANAFGHFKESFLCFTFSVFSTISGRLLLTRTTKVPR